MIWEDEGFIISKSKFRENAIILELFTSKFGKVSGIVYGGNSRKIKNYLQLVNKLHVVYTSKGENRIGYFKVELINAVSPKYFNDKIKTLCLNSLSSLLKAVLPENQSYYTIYESLDKLLKDFDKENWSAQYLNWEINLINGLGFGFNIDSNKYLNMKEKKIIEIKLDNIEYKIPNYLVFKDVKKSNLKDIYYGLNFSRKLIENKFFIPNNIRFPQSRKLLEEKFL